MSLESLRFEARDGISLEGVIDGDDAARAALVVCHPHPRMGGTMDAPLLLALRDEMLQRGWATIRFNFRGVGASQGERGTGLEEVADATAAVSIARNHFPGVPAAIVGWSFGGAVAVRAAALDGALAGCACIAPAVAAKPGVTVGLPTAAELGLHLPLLVVCGSNDDQVSPADCSAWAEQAPTAHYVELAGANHFFWAKYEQLATLIGDWLDSLV